MGQEAHHFEGLRQGHTPGRGMGEVPVIPPTTYTIF